MRSRVAAPASAAQRLSRRAGLLALVSVLLLVGTAALGPSAAQPPLGPRSGWRGALPPYSLDVRPSSALVTVLLVVGYLLGAGAVAAGLLAARRGARTPTLWLAAAGCVAAVAILVPPIGTADHLSYAAYGRIVVQGGDPYLEAPASWRGGNDPVTSAVEAPWTTTPSIYGPVASGVQAAVSVVGGDSVRATVWVWQLVCLASWLAIGLVLHRRTGPDPRAHARASWLWLLNPVLLGLLLMGAHVDLLGAALGLGALVLAGRRPLAAGLLLGAAIGVKVTFALLGPAILYALWRNRSGLRPALLGILGAALVLVPTYLLAGPHVFDQLSRARRFVSLATPWRLLVDALTGPLPSDTVRTAVQVAWPILLVLLVVVVAKVVGLPVGRRSEASGASTAAADWVTRDAALAGVVTRDAALAGVVLGTAYLLAAPYSLPWYDAIVWAPLGLVASIALDTVLIVRLAALAIAYVPGRVVGLSASVEELTLGYRRQVAPWIGVALLLTLLVLARRRPRLTARPLVVSSQPLKGP